MLKSNVWSIVLIAVFCGTAPLLAQSPACGNLNAGHLPLSCEAIYATRANQGNLGTINATLASQLSQLPIATAVSGSGLVFNSIFPESTDSLGTILTQRGETIGRHRFFASFSYQRFSFDDLDGHSLNNLKLLNPDAKTNQTNFIQDKLGLDIDQYTALATYGLTHNVDVSVIVPFSSVHFDNSAQVFSLESGNTYGLRFQPTAHGNASGIGDVIANVKWNFFKSSSEHTNVAIATEVRFPTGDESNLLGSGAYGVKPYMVISHTAKRFTPNVNVGFQWNGTSSLNPGPNGNPQNLPNSFLYAGGLDFRVNNRLTLDTEYLGQFVINGFQTVSTQHQLNFSTGQSSFSGSVIDNTQSTNYSMNNLGVGLKLRPWRHLNISANALFSLDRAGLRSTVIPLFGISYAF